MVSMKDVLVGYGQLHGSYYGHGQASSYRNEYGGTKGDESFQYSRS